MNKNFKARVFLLSLAISLSGNASVALAEFRISYVPIAVDDITIVIPVANLDTDGDGIPDYDDPSIPPEEVFNGFGSALIAGNFDAAVKFISPSKRDTFEQAFTQLGSVSGSVMTGITDTTVISSGPNMMELGVNRMVDGKLRAYIVTLMKGGDGVWRISEM
jgi:hypothetical protein